MDGIAAAAFYPITHWLMNSLDFKGGQVVSGTVQSIIRGTHGVPSATDLWLCTLIGIGVTACLFVITDYYTSTRFRPVRTTARASHTGSQESSSLPSLPITASRIAPDGQTRNRRAVRWS